jgi:hypothetical protein
MNKSKGNYASQVNTSCYKTKTTNNHIPQYFCNDEIPFNFNNPNYMSPNQKLGNGQNPKTLIRPLVVAPSHDLGFWKANNLIKHSVVNEVRQIDDYLSGYAVSTRDNYKDYVEIPVIGNEYREDFLSPKPVEVNPFRIPVIGNEYREDFSSPKPVEVNPARIPVIGNEYREDFSPPRHGQLVEQYSDQKEYTILPNESGWVNTTCGYNPEQVFDNNLPSNITVGNCDKTPHMKQYNKNLFTQTVTPGVYTRNQINEPIGSNIGISFQQQFQPVTCSQYGDELHYLEHDPRIIEPATYTNDIALEIPAATPANVYDPRFNGYGTSYRSYNNKMLGQTRFMYDDVDAIRRPNYVVRSKIDFLPYADSYGTMKSGQESGNPLTGGIRAMAQDSWLKDSLQFRNDLSERRMRKINANHWRKRDAPIQTSGSYQAGSRC